MGARVVPLIRFGIVAWFAITSVIFSSGSAQAETKGSKASPPVPWSKIAESERKVLSPLEKDWNQLPAVQQRRLITSARQYPKLGDIDPGPTPGGPRKVQESLDASAC